MNRSVGATHLQRTFWVHVWILNRERVEMARCNFPRPYMISAHYDFPRTLHKMTWTSVQEDPASGIESAAFKVAGQWSLILKPRALLSHFTRTWSARRKWVAPYPTGALNTYSAYTRVTAALSAAEAHCTIIRREVNNLREGLDKATKPHLKLFSSSSSTKLAQWKLVCSPGRFLNWTRTFSQQSYFTSESTTPSLVPCLVSALWVDASTSWGIQSSTADGLDGRSTFRLQPDALCLRTRSWNPTIKLFMHYQLYDSCLNLFTSFLMVSTRALWSRILGPRLALPVVNSGSKTHSWWICVLASVRSWRLNPVNRLVVKCPLGLSGYCRPTRSESPVWGPDDSVGSISIKLESLSSRGGGMLDKDERKEPISMSYITFSTYSYTTIQSRFFRKCA